jgi:hypothetical protein
MGILTKYSEGYYTEDGYGEFIRIWGQSEFIDALESNSLFYCDGISMIHTTTLITDKIKKFDKML